MVKTKTRKRVQITDFPPTITDQDSAKELTMKSIVAKLEKGIMPRMTSDGIYLQKPTTAVNYQDVHQLQQEALSFYHQLPSKIKIEMGNDPKNLEHYINDPRNQQTLIEQGLLVTRKEDTNLVELIQNSVKSALPQTNPNNPTDPIKKTP